MLVTVAATQELPGTAPDDEVASRVMLLPERVGPVVSETVTVNWQVAVLSSSSVAVAVTSVVPVGKCVLELWL